MLKYKKILTGGIILASFCLGLFLYKTKLGNQEIEKGCSISLEPKKYCDCLKTQILSLTNPVFNDRHSLAIFNNYKKDIEEAKCILDNSYGVFYQPTSSSTETNPSSDLKTNFDNDLDLGILTLNSHVSTWYYYLVFKTNSSTQVIGYIGRVFGGGGLGVNGDGGIVGFKRIKAAKNEIIWVESEEHIDDHNADDSTSSMIHAVALCIVSKGTAQQSNCPLFIPLSYEYSIYPNCNEYGDDEEGEAAKLCITDYITQHQSDKVNEKTVKMEGDSFPYFEITSFKLEVKITDDGKKVLINVLEGTPDESTQKLIGEHSL